MYMLDAARTYLAAGLCPLPTLCLGSKMLDRAKLERTYGVDVFQRNPAGQLDTIAIPRLPTDAELMYWFNETGPLASQLAIATGAISGGLVVLDFDVKNVLGVWREEARKLQVRASECPIVTTPRGHHVYFRIEGEMPQSAALARIPDRPWSLVDVRGEGGWVMAPPSVGGSDNLRPYYELGRSIVEVQEVSGTDATKLIDAATLRSLYRTEIDLNWGDAVGTVGLTTRGIKVEVMGSKPGTRQSLELDCAQALELLAWLRWNGPIIERLREQIELKREQDDYDYAMATSGGYDDDSENY